MQPIVRQKQEFPENFFYFLDSLIDIFNSSTNESLWAFSVRRGTEALYEYVDRSKYQRLEEALGAAKRHVLVNFCERSDQLNCLTDFSTDCILVQSERAIALFGNAKNAIARNFYPNPQDRIEALRDLQIKGGTTEHKSRLTNLGGQKLTGVTSFELIELGSNSRFMLELFKPYDVHD